MPSLSVQLFRYCTYVILPILAAMPMAMHYDGPGFEYVCLSPSLVSTGVLLYLRFRGIPFQHQGRDLIYFMPKGRFYPARICDPDAGTTLFAKDLSPYGVRPNLLLLKCIAMPIVVLAAFLFSVLS